MTNSQWQRALLILNNNIGVVLEAQGDLAGALDAFEKGEKIALQLKAANPPAATSDSDLERVQALLAETRQKIGAAVSSR
jgi:hypothetical protein